MKKTTLIGKKYRPCDNSYSVNLTSMSIYPYKNNGRLLAGTQIIEPKICTIVSEPFDCIIHKSASKIESYKMIMVEYNNETHSVLYYEHCVIDEMSEID